MPDMQTALKTALSNAKVVRKPVIERVWLWLKDHPGKTAKEIAQVFPEASRGISSLISQMFNRQMLIRTAEFERRSMRQIYRFSVSSRMQEYELLPAIKGSKLPKSRVEVASPQVVPKPADTPVPDEPRTIAVLWSAEYRVSQMKVVEAKELYEELKKIFGNSAT